MDILTIIGIVLAIVLVILVFKFVKSMVKALTILLVILVMLSVVFSFLVYRDIRDFRKDLKEGENLFILKDKEHFVTGFILSQGNQTDPIDNLEELETHYNDKDYKKILGDKQRLFIFEYEHLETEDDFSKILKNGMGVLDILGISIDVDVESYAFMYIMLKNYKDKDHMNFIKDYKEEKLIVYPETLMFRILKFVVK